MKKTLLMLSLCLLAKTQVLSAGERPIDTSLSRITIHVGKTGLFSAAGHEHQVSAPIEEGAIDDSEPARVRFSVRPSRLTVLPDADQAAVQSTMQANVLESAKYPDIKFESTSIRRIGDSTWTVTGDLTLHGMTNPITTEVHKTSSGYSGEVRIKQSQFGIKPVSVAGGTVKVKDEVRIDFVIRPKG